LFHKLPNVLNAHVADNYGLILLLNFQKFSDIRYRLAFTESDAWPTSTKPVNTI